MKICWVVCLTLALLISAPSLLAADGTFRGKVVDPPGNQPASPGWIFVQGRNRMLRRVEVSHAAIVFGDEVPAHQRHKCNSDCLGAGQEVRVTARQDAAGEWRANRVEILRLPTQAAWAPQKAFTLPNFTRNAWIRRITNSSNNASHPIREKST
ncbi:MAG: hypothetical protein WA738_21360 [Candidatus Angelobacter sp.]